MRYITIILIALLCAACSSALPSLKPYRMDIQQGNVVTSKMMLQLRPGMTKSQVRFIMGTPLIQDSFHANRWDYFYQMRKGGKIIEQRRVILEFENEALKRVRGDVIPAGTGEAVADPSPVTESPKSVKKKEKKGLLDRLKFWGDEPEQEKPQEAPAELISPAATPTEPAPAEPAEKSMPAESAQPAQETPKKEQAPTEEVAPAQPAEGMPEPGAPLGPDPEHLEKGTAPAVEAPQAREIDEPAQPVEPQAEPAPAAEPASAPEPVEPAPAESKPVVEEQPAKTEAPKAEPAQQPTPAKQTKPEPQPEPDDEGLPPEDDPGYFERMLEKIGF